MLKAAYTGQWREQGTLVPKEDQVLIQRAIETKLTRHPIIGKGSTVILMPQVSQELTRMNAHSTIYMNQATLKVLGADHDGDAGMLDATRDLNADDWLALRNGAQYLVPAAGVGDTDPTFTPTGDPADTRPAQDVWAVEIDNPDDEAILLREFKEAAADPELEPVVEQGITLIASAFLEKIADVVGDPVLDYDKVEQALVRFRDNVRAGNEEARRILVNEIFNLDKVAVTLTGDTANEPADVDVVDHHRQVRGHSQASRAPGDDGAGHRASWDQDEGGT